MARTDIVFRNGDIVELNGLWYTVYDGGLMLKDNHKRPMNEQAKLIWRSDPDNKRKKK